MAHDQFGAQIKSFKLELSLLLRIFFCSNYLYQKISPEPNLAGLNSIRKIWFFCQFLVNNILCQVQS